MASPTNVSAQQVIIAKTDTDDRLPVPLLIPSAVVNNKPMSGSLSHMQQPVPSMPVIHPAAATLNDLIEALSQQQQQQQHHQQQQIGVLNYNQTTVSSTSSVSSSGGGGGSGSGSAGESQYPSQLEAIMKSPPAGTTVSANVFDGFSHLWPFEADVVASNQHQLNLNLISPQVVATVAAAAAASLSAQSPLSSSSSSAVSATQPTIINNLSPFLPNQQQSQQIQQSPIIGKLLYSNPRLQTQEKTNEFWPPLRNLN